MIITTLPNQSILDICLSKLGSIEGVFDLLHLNDMKTLELTDSSIIDLPTVKNLTIVNWYSINGLNPATNVDASFYVGDFNDDFNNDFNI